MADMTVAVSEAAFRKSFEVMIKNVRWEAEDSTNFGPFTAGYHIKGHLEGGSIDLRADNTISVREVDIRWDMLKFMLGLDIPKICVGGGCIDLPWPLPDLCLPEFCLFKANPDIYIEPDLAAFVAQEVSFTAGLDIRYYDANLPAPPWYSPCVLLRDLLDNANVIEPLPNHNQWHIHIQPGPIDIDLFDFADVVGNLIENALTSAITALIPGGWVRDLLLAIIGSVADLIRWVLDIPDDIEEWLSDLFNISFGLLDLLGQMVLEFFGACVPIYRIDDPFEIMPKKTTTGLRLDQAAVTLVPVAVPVRNLSASVTDVEMIVQADIGA